MGTEVPGQLFGYTLQYPRAYLRLLEIPDDASVAIEELADVSVTYSDGSIMVEEDKSSISNKNPVSDHSVNLWKTFYNWIYKINNKELDINRDSFILYSNYQANEKSLVVRMGNKENLKIEPLIQEIELIYNSIEKDNAIYKYLAYLLKSENLGNLKKLICKFEFVNDKNADDVYLSIKKQLKHDLCIDDEEKIKSLLLVATGWLQNQYITKISNHEDPIVTRKEYRKFIRPHIRSINDSILFDYAKSKIISDEQKNEELNKNPTYIKQLRLIEMDDEIMINAIDDYYKAEINRDRWNEDGILSEEDIRNFKNDLKSACSKDKIEIDIVHSSRTDVEKGKLLYVKSQDKRILLAQKEPPSRTIQGTYQLLADEKELGWHPHWKEIIGE